MTSRKQLRELDPAVVQRATEFVEAQHYSCHALLRALVGEKWVYIKPHTNPYTVAYEHYSFACAGGERPLWWNASRSYLEERTQALEDFRDAIIKAKKPTFFERIKDWLASPCEIPN